MLLGHAGQQIWQEQLLAYDANEGRTHRTGERVARAAFEMVAKIPG